MLYDEAAGILFTGDTFYLGALYAHFDCPQFGRSDLEKYRATLERLVAMLPDSVMLYCSHNDFMVPIGKLREAADLMARLGDDLEAGAPNAGHQYLEDGNVLRETPGDGFSIVYAER